MWNENYCLMKTIFTKHTFGDIWVFNMHWKLIVGEHNLHQTYIWRHLSFQYAMETIAWSTQYSPTCSWRHLICQYEMKTTVCWTHYIPNIHLETSDFQYAMKTTARWKQSSPNMHLETSEFSIYTGKYCCVSTIFTKHAFGYIWFSIWNGNYSLVNTIFTKPAFGNHCDTDTRKCQNDKTNTTDSITLHYTVVFLQQMRLTFFGSVHAPRGLKHIYTYDGTVLCVVPKTSPNATAAELTNHTTIHTQIWSMDLCRIIRFCRTESDVCSTELDLCRAHPKRKTPTPLWVCLHRSNIWGCVLIFS